MESAKRNVGEREIVSVCVCVRERERKRERERERERERNRKRVCESYDKKDPKIL